MNGETGTAKRTYIHKRERICNPTMLLTISEFIFILNYVCATGQKRITTKNKRTK